MTDIPFTPTGPVTGDAVELEIRPASLGARIVAIIIDMLVQVVLLVCLVLWLVTTAGDLSSNLVQAVVTAIFVGVFVACPAVVETLTRGRSLGKVAIGLRVVRDDHGTIRARQAIGRALIGYVELWMLAGVPAVLTSVFNKRGKRLGDLASGTIVVSERVPLRWPAPMPMPPSLAAWATHADIAPLDPRVTLGARQYLLRRGQLSPVARQRLAVQLADELRTRVSPQPPISTPDDLIMAIIAERGRRDRARLARDEELRGRLFGSGTLPTAVRDTPWLRQSTDDRAAAPPVSR
ncbi:RDD family protein [Aestuariimicrobium soli]|uniref:RDD family protein n=1 Tax=Aestuariimicrobium soli TaxID=2035834 RepID=UPI003EBCA10E